jgi:hypothetical protein
MQVVVEAVHSVQVLRLEPEDQVAEPTAAVEMLVQLIPVAEVEAKLEEIVQEVVLVVQVLSLFVMQIHSQQPLQLLVHQQ